MRQKPLIVLGGIASVLAVGRGAIAAESAVIAAVDPPALTAKPAQPPPSPPLPEALPAGAVPETSTAGAVAEAAQASPPPRTLRQLAIKSILVASVRASAAEPREQGRIIVYPLRIERIVWGSKPASDQILLVELRGASTRPPLLEAGASAVVLLQPLSQVSYLREHVREPNAFEAVAGRDGIIRFAGREQGVEVAGSMLRARDARSPLQIRSHAFSELGSDNPRLVEDGVHELAALSPLQGLTEREKSILAVQLSNTSIPGQTRVRLIETLGRGQDRAAASLLAGAFTETARLLEAALRARAKLGAPAGSNELNVHLGSPDLGVRSAALRALAVSRHAYAAAILANAVSPHEPREIRLAAIDALAELEDSASLGALAAAFESDDQGIKQASARAILAKGDHADDALVDLALRGISRETRTYAAMLLLTRRSRAHPSVQRLASSSPSPDVVEVLEKGLQDSHAHEH
ncbi:MAG TPA: HEAT repeat domain-containing protein [Candidatus Binatia bacterium]|nr:HEAT repeat domain-containing protein [Candidatus Binatia bacterium]